MSEEELEKEIQKYIKHYDIYEQNKRLQQEIDKLTKKCEILEENNKLLIQQKAKMYEDLDIAYGKINKAIEYNKNILKESWYGANEKKYAKTNLAILGDKENE